MSCAFISNFLFILGFVLVLGHLSLWFGKKKGGSDDWLYLGIYEVGQLHGLGRLWVNQRIFCLGVIFNYKILCHIILKYDTLSPVSNVRKKKKKTNEIRWND